MQYAIRALTADHLITALTIDAEDEADARRKAEARGLYAASVSPVQPLALAALRGRGGRRRFPLVLFSKELLALLNAGLSIVEALEALLEKEVNEEVRAVLSRLLSTLQEGKRFSAALAEQPGLFPPLYVGIMRAAEGTSDLPRSLARYIDYQERIDGIRSKVISSSIYPVILLLVGGCVTLFLVGYVVPRFAELYQGAGRELPFLSKLLLGWGQFAARNTELLGFGILGAAVGLGLSVRRLVVTGRLASIVKKIPGIRDRARIYELSRLYLTLGMLLEGGVPVLAAMETAKGMVSPDVHNRLRVASTKIESGIPLSTAFDSSGLATPISLRMLRVGERSGQLSEMLTQSANFYDGEIARWIDRFTRAFEPLLMTAIGLVVGLIVVLLYMPIFDLAGSLS